MFCFVLFLARIQRLVEQSKRCTDSLLGKISSTNLLFNKSICRRFDEAMAKMTKIALTTEDCIESIKYIEHLKTDEMFKLKDLVRRSASYILFYLDYGFFGKEDFFWNNHALTWYDTMRPMIVENESRLLRQRETWLTKLKQKRHKLNADLNASLKRVKDLKPKERLSEAEAIVAELKHIADDVEQFRREKHVINHEERLLNLEEQTEFEAIHEIVRAKEPFDKLWKTTLDFYHMNEKWMSSTIGSVNAQEIETSV